MRSTSMATASIACSIRSSRSVTSLGNRRFLDCASILREYALTSGIPITITIAVANAPSGTTISGPCISVCPHGAGAVCGYRELYLRSLAQRTCCGDGSIVRPNGLPRDREAQTRSTGLVRHVRLPDPFQILRRDALAVVSDGDSNGVTIAHFSWARRDGDAPLFARRIHRIQQNVAERAGER